MTKTGLAVFDDTVHKTNAWLHEIGARLGWDDRAKAYRLLRVTLHALRDALSAEEAANLSAQLPLLIRGVFFEGWRPGRIPLRPPDRAAFLGAIGAAFSDEVDFDAEAAVREVFDVATRHLDPGAVAKLHRELPDFIAELWDGV